jgi:hypothetical protein
MTRAEEDALLRALVEAEGHIRNMRIYVSGQREPIDRAYVAKLLRHALQIVEGEKP